MASDPSKEVGKVFQVVLAFGEQDRRAPFGQRARDVSQDEPVAVLVSRQCRVERLDPIEGFLATGAKHRLADHQAVIERPPSRIAAGVNRKAHRAKLHLGDRVKTIPPTGRGRQAGQEACLHLRQHPLEGHGGDVVTLIDNYVAVGRHQIVDAVQPDETLDHRHVQAAVGGVLPGANLADGLGSEPEEHGQLGNPLIEEWLPVDQDECAARSGCDQIGADDGLADTRRRDQDADVVTEQSPTSLLLHRGEQTLKHHVQRFAIAALVLDEEGAVVLAKELFELGPTAAGQGDMLRQFLGTGDHARSERRGEPEALFLVELGILKCCQALDLVEVGRRQSGLGHEEPLR